MPSQIALMDARFEGGGYDGYTFKVPIESPYKGLDVMYEERALRYGFERTEAGVAIYVFSRELEKPPKAYHQIDLHADMRAVALRFYPPKAKPSAA